MSAKLNAFFSILFLVVLGFWINDFYTSTPKPSPVVLNSGTALTVEQTAELDSLDECQTKLDSVIAEAKAAGIYSGEIKRRAERIQKEINDARQKVLTGAVQ